MFDPLREGKEHLRDVFVVAADVLARPVQGDFFVDFLEHLHPFGVIPVPQGGFVWTVLGGVSADDQ
ncbi:Uncharacterised protein [Mycobacteroides abscessus subsp. abscessus]|nr:Uncharacterised protein [Mycobacteroides abscessus subsp. abscessus]